MNGIIIIEKLKNQFIDFPFQESPLCPSLSSRSTIKKALKVLEQPPALRFPCRVKSTKFLTNFH